MKFKYINFSNASTVINFYKKRDRNNEKFILVQFIELLKLWAKTGYIPYNYYKYKPIWKKNEKLSTIYPYIPGRLFDEIREEYLNYYKYLCLTDNKFIFNNWLRIHNIRTTNQIEIIFPYNVIDIKNIKKLFEIHDGIVIKPITDSAQGKDILVLNSKSELDNNTSLYIKKLNNGFIIEEKIKQHTSINKIYKYSINTIRIDTIKDVYGKTHLLNAFLRTGRNGRRVDNWSGEQGGIAIAINKSTGRLSPEGFDYFCQSYKIHPDSKIHFDNIIIPYWTEVCEQVELAAQSIPGIASIGWDIAISDQGPIVIEANSDYGIRSMQTTCGPYGNNPIFTKTILGYMKKKKKYNKSFLKITRLCS